MTDDRKLTQRFPAVTPPRESAPPSAPPVPSLPGTQRFPSSPVSSGRSRPSLVDPDWLREEETNVSRTTETFLEVPVQVREKNRALITVTNGFNAGQVFALEERETIIGRGRDAHVRLEDAGVSRHHARIVKTETNDHLVEDLSSTNGTFVAGRRVERISLESGDQIQLGPNVSIAFALFDEKAEQLAKQLYESSTRDPLTGAFNRRYFAERLAGEVAYANRHRTRLGVVLFDLDHFKRVNDTYGHLAGDQVLRAVADAVAKMIRVEDVFARYGGEEFVILVRGIEHVNVARFGDRIRRAVERLSVSWELHVVQATISLGVASLDECGDLGTGEALILLSDERLYQAKRRGRNCVQSE